MTPVIDPPRHTTEPASSWVKPGQDQPEKVFEETSGRKAPRSASIGAAISGTPRQMHRSFGEAVAEDSGIRFRVASPTSRDQQSPLAGSFRALSKVKQQSSAEAVWIEAAATLKADAVRLRETQYSRHSSVLLALADALVFTTPGDSTLDFRPGTFDRALALLSEPFLPEEEEEDFLVDLMSHGWNLVPAACNGE